MTRAAVKEAPETEAKAVEKPAMAQYRKLWFSEADDHAYAEATMENLAGAVRQMEWFAGFRPDLVETQRKALHDCATRLHNLACDPEEFYRQRLKKMAEIEI